MDWSSIFTWVMGGGLTTVLVFALKANAQLRALKVGAAKAKADVELQKAKEAQFEASIAESSTKVAGEGILRGLLITLTQREQEAHASTSLVMKQLQEAREINGGFREEIAELREREDQCQLTLRQMQETQLSVQSNHDRQIRALHDRIYNLSQRMLQAGGAFTATDVMPDADR